MSETVKQAAERYRAGYSQACEPGTMRRYPNPECERDADILARAYLAENDDTAIDEAWLRSVGPPEDESISIATFFIPSEGMYAGALDFRKNGQVHLCAIRIKHPPQTRGQLRLVAASTASSSAATASWPSSARQASASSWTMSSSAE
jgi:hypothetical protein